MSPPVKRHFRHIVLAWVRWLHIYLSLVGFGVIFFFAITGITLNHPTWFGLSAEQTQQVNGELPVDWLLDASAAPTVEGEAVAPTIADKLAVVERLRSAHQIHGALAEFRTDDAECMVTFKGPGYAADAFIQRASGKYELTIARLGFVAVVNDLHKGRDSGAAWSVLIDVSAALMAISAITGVLLLLFLRRHRIAGLATLAVGSAAATAVFHWLVP